MTLFPIVTLASSVQLVKAYSLILAILSGIIIEVMQKGYTLNGRLIRPAMVVVAK